MAWVVTAVAAALEVGATFAVIATAVAEVGIAMTVVGTVTKSKELTKVGGFLSLAGGVASLGAAAVGSLGQGAVAATGAAELGSSAAVDGGANALSDAAAASTADAVGGSGAAPLIAGPSSDVANAVAGFDPNAASVLPSAPTGSSAYLTPPSSAVPPASPSTPGTFDFLKDSGSATDVSGVPDALGQSASKPGLGQSVKDWYNGLSKSDQSRVGNTLLQMGGQAVGGLFNGWTADQKLQLEQQAQSLAKQKFDTATTNASAVPDISFKPVGLVNSVITKGK